MATRDEILAMDAAQLERAIAASRGEPWCKPTHGSCCTCQTCGQDHDDCKCGITGDIGKAWELVEEMPIAVDVMKIADGLYFCGCNGSEDFQGYHFYPEATSTTAPLAICRAWLMWKEGV